MKDHIAYLKYVLRHKWYVARGARLVRGVPFWRVVFHDWDKFFPDEWFAYVHTFYAPDGSKQYKETRRFARAWNYHQKRNRHHWQYWLITWDRGTTEALQMRRSDVLEMLADWIGAGWAINGSPNPRPWYEANRENINLHPYSRALIEIEMDRIFPAPEDLL